ncbi:MAG: hypothetical protein IMW85_07905, partial [Thermicanus sp.]|nr:hypothetical protein [Thermicanus sp.]
MDKKKKAFHLFLFLILVIMLPLSGCSLMTTQQGQTQKEQTQNGQTPQKDSSSAKKNEESEGNPPSSEKDNGLEQVTTVVLGQTPAQGTPGAPEDQGSYTIRMEGEIHEEDGKIVIEGKSNLLPGSRLRGHISGKGYGLMGYVDREEVQANGNYTLKITKPDIEDIIDIFVEFEPEEQQEKINTYYGQKGEKMTGPLIYLYDRMVDGKSVMFKKASLKKRLRLKDGDKIVGTFEQPTWDRPADYGSTKVWITTEVKKDDAYVYVKGKSNLLEGCSIYAVMHVPDAILIGYGDGATTNPDGSFEMAIRYPKSYKEMEVSLEFRPNENSWESIRETYGEKGEKLEGPYVKKGSNGGKYVEI